MLTFVQHHSTMSNRDKHAARMLPVSFVGPLSGDHSFIPPDPVWRTQNGEGSSGPSRSEGGSQFSTRHPRHRDRAGPQAQQLPQPAQEDRNARRAAFGAGLTPRESDNEQPRSHGGAHGSGTRSPAEPVDEVTAARHADLLNRVAMMVDFSDSKMSSFKHAVRQFKQNEAPARDMINTFYSIFDRDTDTTLRMAREVSNLMQDDRDKLQSILEAVNAFKLEVSHPILSPRRRKLTQLSSDKQSSPPLEGRRELVRASPTSRPAASCLPRAPLNIRQQPMLSGTVSSALPHLDPSLVLRAPTLDLAVARSPARQQPSRLLARLLSGRLETQATARQLGLAASLKLPQPQPSARSTCLVQAPAGPSCHPSRLRQLSRACRPQVAMA